jgi:hypothetical protein
MANPRNGDFTGYNAIQLAGESETINSQAVTGLLADSNGDLLICTGIVTITDGGTGFAKGCLYIDTDVATGTTGLYCNKGTNTSCQFTAVTQA